MGMVNKQLKTENYELNKEKDAFVVEINRLKENYDVLFGEIQPLKLRFKELLERSSKSIQARLLGTLKYKRFVLYIMVVFENPLFVLLLRRALFRTFIVVSMLLD